MILSNIISPIGLPKVLFLLFVTLFVASIPAAQARVPVGIAAALTGDVRMKNAAVTKARKIRLRQRMAWGDTVITEKKSKLQVLLRDRSSLTVGANAQLTIDSFVYDPGKSRTSVSTVAKGAFRFMSGRKTPASKARFNTPSGSIGIRGTMLDGIIGKKAVKFAKKEAALKASLKGVKHDKKTATLVILRGPGPNTAGDLNRGLADVTGAGVTVALDRPGLAAYIPRPGAPPIGPFQISARGLSRIQDELAPGVASANSGGGLGALLPAIAVGVAAGVLLSGDGDDNPNQPTADIPRTCDPRTQPNGIC